MNELEEVQIAGRVGKAVLAVGLAGFAAVCIVGSMAYIAGRTDQAVAQARREVLPVRDCYWGRVREAGQAAVVKVLVCQGGKQA